MAELAYAEVSKTFVQKTCGFDPRCSHHSTGLDTSLVLFIPVRLLNQNSYSLETQLC